MKKKFRNITVGDQEYAWMSKGGTLTIWKDKKVIQEEWLGHTTTVIPSMVAEMIKGEYPPMLNEDVLVLNPGDMTLEARKKNTCDVQFTDILGSRDLINKASVVLYVNKFEMKILKTKYKIVE